MQTIKIPYQSQEDLKPYFKQYSSVLRFAYNRYTEGLNEKEIRLLSKDLNNIHLLNSWLIQCAIRDAKAVHERFKDQRSVIFGGRHLFKQLVNKKISKEEFEIKRLSSITSQGMKQFNGNLCFKLDISNQQIIFTCNFKNKLQKQYNKSIILQLPNLRKNIKKQLLELEEINKTSGHTYTIKLTQTHICISFEPLQKQVINLKENRYIGIDLNPAEIGISVIDSGQVLEAKQFSISDMIYEFRNKKLASNSAEAKYYQNKIKHETCEIAKQIAELAKHNKCKYVFIEQLKFEQKVSSKHAGEKRFNRLVKNLWKKELFIQNLKKRLQIYGIKLLEVGAAYSSYIGNLQHNYSDAINASIEIARRGYELRVLKRKNAYYPVLEVKQQWKQMATSYMNWKDMCFAIKNSGLRYRVSLEDLKGFFDVLKFNCTTRSRVLAYSMQVV